MVFLGCSFIIVSVGTYKIQKHPYQGSSKANEGFGGFFRKLKITDTRIGRDKQQG
jgi:hypothetical protein